MNLARASQKSTAANGEVFCVDDGGNVCRAGLVLTCDWDWTQQLVVSAGDH